MLEKMVYKGKDEDLQYPKHIHIQFTFLDS